MVANCLIPGDRDCVGVTVDCAGDTVHALATLRFVTVCVGSRTYHNTNMSVF